MKTAVKYVIWFLMMSVFLASCGKAEAETVLLDSGSGSVSRDASDTESGDSSGDQDAEESPAPAGNQVIQVVCNCHCTQDAVPDDPADGAETSVPAEAADAAVQPADPDDGKVNINTADAARLQTLNGIGATRAQDIISYREANGTFQSIEDIKNVPGIKDGIYSKIKDDISV